MMADVYVYIPRDDERCAMIALKKRPRAFGLRTAGDKVDGRVARRLIARGYAQAQGQLVHLTAQGLEALERCAS